MGASLPRQVGASRPIKCVDATAGRARGRGPRRGGARPRAWESAASLVRQSTSVPGADQVREDARAALDRGWRAERPSAFTAASRSRSALPTRSLCRLASGRLVELLAIRTRRRRRRACAGRRPRPARARSSGRSGSLRELAHLFLVEIELEGEETERTAHAETTVAEASARLVAVARAVDRRGRDRIRNRRRSAAPRRRSADSSTNGSCLGTSRGPPLPRGIARPAGSIDAPRRSVERGRHAPRAIEDSAASTTVNAAFALHPFTQTTCFSVCTTSTRSRCAAITASMSL